MGECPLCGSTVSGREYRDFVDVRCAECGDFIMTRTAVHELGADDGIKAELARQTRWIARSGGRAFLGTDTVEKARRRVAGG